MPQDITACPGQGCPLRETCLRYTGVFHGRFDSFTSLPYDAQARQCAQFVSDRPAAAEIRELAYKLWQQDGCNEGRNLEYWLRAEQQLVDLRRNS